jgi:hypothetical protein
MDLQVLLLEYFLDQNREFLFRESLFLDSGFKKLKRPSPIKAGVKFENETGPSAIEYFCHV